MIKRREARDRCRGRCETFGEENRVPIHARARAFLESVAKRQISTYQELANALHLQRPTPSDISKNAPSLQGLSHAGVARSRRRRMFSAVKPDEPASNFQQRDNALSRALRTARCEACRLQPVAAFDQDTSA